MFPLINDVHRCISSMSNSVFTVTEPDSSDSITLVISPDGTVTPDKAVVQSFLSTRTSVDINLMTMKQVEAGKVNITLDNLTYLNSEDADDDPEEMDEIARNLRAFRLDHDYTPLTSPPRQPRELEMAEDEIVQALSMLEEGVVVAPPQTRPEPLTKITKIVKGKRQTMFVNSKQKAKMISTGLLKERPSTEGMVFKKPKPISPGKTLPKPKIASPVQVIIEPPVVKEVEKIEEPPAKPDELDDFEDEDLFDEEDLSEEDDENDSDFELEEELRQKPVSRRVRIRKRSESNRSRPDRAKRKLPIVKQASIEKVEPPEVIKPIEVITHEKFDAKVPDKKPMPKKEKKAPKPMPDDFALFSTPDIIRRVGKEVPSSPEKLPLPPPPPAKPAKIIPENRSKSNNLEVKGKRLSTDSTIGDLLPEKTRRLSLDVKKQDRRPSFDAKMMDIKDDQVSVQEFSDTLNNSNESTPDEQLEPLPSAEDIRAIIQNENTKSFTSNLVIPDQNDLPADVSNNPLNLEAGLDLDQSILDNINTDMINEDILYQVAKSLVDNPALQNVLDKSINDGNLVLDPSLQHVMGAPGDHSLVPSLDTVNLQSIPSNTSEVETMPKPGMQIVRPDGRVVVIPPIERPTTRSRNRRRDMTPPPIRQLKPTHKPLDEEHVSGNELDSSEDGFDEDESEDDPNKLWCICNQPHNNRFMICCDTCEEWYHGKCVNVTKAMGHLMEQEGKEWICVYCRDASLRRPKAAARRIRKASRTSTDSGGGSAKKVTSTTAPTTSATSTLVVDERKSSAPGCVVCGKPSRSSSIYCSDACILKHAQGVEKVVVFDRKSGKLLSGINAPSAANLNNWLKENPTYEAVRSINKPVAPKPAPAVLTQSKLKLVKNSGNDGVSLAVQKKGINIGVMQHAPKEGSPSRNHHAGIKSTSKKITGLKIISKQLGQPQYQPKIKVVPAAPITPRPTLTATPAKPTKLVQTKLKLTVEPTAPLNTKQKQPMPQKTPKAREAEVNVQPKQDNLRETVRKTFFDQLANRLKKVEDLKLTEEELKGISNEIESQLYKCFGDTGQKYKNKYRSLIFNIKDAKNQTLWRRICEKAVNPYQLVRLSPDDLASQELALWREREAKHQLDMIKKSELELLNCTRQYVFKTHKGEQVFEDDRPKDQVTEIISGLSADSSTTPEKEENVVDNKEKEKKVTSKHKKDRSRDRSRGHSRESNKSRRDKSESKDRKRDRRSLSRDRKKRSRSKEHGSRHSDRKRSRSRDRHRRSSHKSSRHKKEEKSINTERLDKKSKEILEQLVDKQIVPPLEDRLWKHVPQEDIIPTPTVESDSDHEPSSTVTIPTPPRSSEPDDSVQSKSKSLKENECTPQDTDDGIKSPELRLPAEVIWKGSINMIDVAQISITAHEVSGDCQGLGEELPPTLDIVGRISPDTVWDYIGKMKSSNSKTISVIRMTATNMEERMPYLALYSYLSSRNRLGVVKSVTKGVKDFYILPLAGHTPIPDPLLPLSGPGFEDNRPALLLGVLVRDKKRRAIDALPPPVHTHKRVKVDIVPPGPATPPSSSRSYTPPPSRDPRVKMPPVPLPEPSPELSEDIPEDDMDEPYTPEDSDPDSMPATISTRLNSEDLSNLLTGNVKTSSFLESGLNTQSFEPFSNKFYNIPGLEDPPPLSSNSLELQREMAELDQRIAAQKAEIHKVSQDLVSSATSDIGTSSLANIALPSNLQQILESIKTIGSKTDSVDSQGENSSSSIPSATSDLTIPLMLPKLSSRPLIGAAAQKAETTIPLKLPKLKSKLGQEPEKSSGSVLSSLSEEDLIKKAEEMLADCEPVKRTKDSSSDNSAFNTPPKRPRILGLNDD